MSSMLGLTAVIVVCRRRGCQYDFGAMPRGDCSRLFEIARVLVRFDHVTRFYQRHDHVNLPFLFISMLR